MLTKLFQNNRKKIQDNFGGVKPLFLTLLQTIFKKVHEELIFIPNLIPSFLHTRSAEYVFRSQCSKTYLSADRTAEQ